MTAMELHPRIQVRGRRILSRGLTAAVPLLLVLGGVSAYRLSTMSSPVSLSQAVSRFRARSAPVGLASVMPAAGKPTAAGVAHELQPSGISSVSGQTSAVPGVAAAPVASQSRTPVSPVAAVPPGAPGGPVAPAPAVRSASPGVYTYATDGSERVSALGGSTHSYPSRTTMTVTGTACGTDVRWDALQQRYDTWGLCAIGQGLALRSLTTYHDFFGQVDRRVYTCTADTRFRPDSTAPGTTFGGSCNASGAAAVLHGRVVGVEPLTVGSTSVATVHVHLDEQLTGATSGTRASDSWYALSDNLLVRKTSLTEADTQTSFGPTHYHEAVRLDLTDLRPAT